MNFDLSDNNLLVLALPSYVLPILHKQLIVSIAIIYLFKPPLLKKLRNEFELLPGNPEELKLAIDK